MNVIIGVILIVLVGAGGIVGLTVVARQPIPERTFNEPKAMMDVFETWYNQRLTSGEFGEEYYCGRCGCMMPIAHFPH